MNNTFTFGEFSITLGNGCMVGDTMHMTDEVRRGDEVVAHYLAVFSQADADLVNFRIRPLVGHGWTESTTSYDDAFEQFRRML